MTKKPMEPKFRATRPESVPEKVDECKFFLGMMHVYKERTPIREFLWYLSAFLCAHRSLSYRLYGVLKYLERSDDAKALGETLHSDTDISWLRRLRDLEVHGDGVTVFALPPFGNPLEPAPGLTFYPQRLTEKCQIALIKMEKIIHDTAL